MSTDNESRHEQSFWNYAIWGLCILWTCYQLITAREPLSAFYQRSFHLMSVYVLVYLSLNFKGGQEDHFRWSGLILSFLTIVCIAYATINWSTKAFTRGMALPTTELVLGWVFIILTMEACRRAVGWTIPIISIILIIYARWGESLPDIIAHPNYTFERMVTSFYVSVDGIMGYLAHVSTTFIFIFVLFGAFLRTSGAGDYFIKLAFAVFGHVRGGPGKIAVVASTLFGMVSGSAMANVAGTGQFTIPLMKKYGYPAHFAGGVEATASAGGQIMPPIMGGAAFIICEVLGVSYLFVMKSILIIATLYYLSIFIMLDVEAQKLNLKGIPRNELPKIWATMKEGWFFLIPPILLLVFLGVFRYSPTLSGLYATLSIIIFSWFDKNARMGFKKIAVGMKDACFTFRPIGSVLACSGLLVGLVNMTGLGLTLSDILVQLSYGVLPVLLFLAMVSSIVLGMGVPITASYVILSILVAPALIEMNVPPIAAHLFIFYFGVFSTITPPFAPDAFVAGGIAQAPVMKTAFSACKIGLAGLILPYIMVYNKAFLLQGFWLNVVWVLITAILGLIALSSGINGYLFGRIGWLWRVLLIISALIMIVPGAITDVIGLALFFALCFKQNPRFLKQVSRKILSHLIPSPQGHKSQAEKIIT